MKNLFRKKTDEQIYLRVKKEKEMAKRRKKQKSKLDKIASEVNNVFKVGTHFTYLGVTMCVTEKAVVRVICALDPYFYLSDVTCEYRDSNGRFQKKEFQVEFLLEQAQNPKPQF